MRKIISFAVALLILTGCATHQPLVLSDKASASYEIPVKKLAVDNLATEVKIGVNDVVWVNGWAPAHAGFKPPLHEALVAKIKSSIIPASTDGVVNVSVLRAGFFVEKNYADDMAFVNFFTLGRERGFKCDADINLRTDKDSKRFTVTHEIKRPYFDNAEEIRQFVETCQSDLIRQIAEETKMLI